MSFHNRSDALIKLLGNVLTAIQICEAHDHGVLVLWNSWRHEFYKPMGTLHDDVHELDLSSLYPNIIWTRNVSPDVIQCDCHSDREDVPDLRYSICDDRGYLVNVLQPIIDARDGTGNRFVLDAWLEIEAVRLDENLKHPQRRAIHERIFRNARSRCRRSLPSGAGVRHKVVALTIVVAHHALGDP